MTYTVMRSLIFSYILLPIPLTDIISSLLLKTVDDRYSMIFSAVTSPIPVRVLSSSADAVLMLIRPFSAPQGHSDSDAISFAYSLPFTGITIFCPSSTKEALLTWSASAYSVSPPAISIT